MTVEVKSEGTQMAEVAVSHKEDPIKALEEKTNPAIEEKKLEEKNLEEPKSTLEEKKLEEPMSESSSDSVKVLEKSSSFKEESNFLSDLKENEKKALFELRAKLEEAILENKLFKNEANEKKEDQKPKETQEVKAEEEPKLDPKNKEEKAEESTNKEKQEEANAEEESELDSKIIEEKAEESANRENQEEVKVEEKLEVEQKADGEKTEESVDREVSLWGVPLLPSKNSESTDVVLLKFLRAREFKVKEAFEMIQNTLQWRKVSKIDSILNEVELSVDFGAACYMDGYDREGHPVCYNVSGVFEDEEIYKNAFGSEEGREKFLRWRVQVMEKGIEKLDLRPGGVSKLLQITDLKNSVGPSKKELRDTMKQAVQILQDNYPELVARNIFINVPFWYYAFNALLSPFLTQRTKSKFVFARPAKVTETLLKYIPAEAIPIHYGGFKRENDIEFSVEVGGVSELMVKAGSTETVEIPAPEAGTTLIWDLTVLGWEVNYKEEFVPTDEGSYTIIVQKGKKMGSEEEPIRNSFRNNEPGKIVLTIENGTFKKKKVLFRYKTKSS